MANQATDPFFVPLAGEELASLIPSQLNDPFGLDPPEICKIAVADLCNYIEAQQGNWEQNFGFGTAKEGRVKGKMFGVLVVENKDGRLGYLATFSGKFTGPSQPRIFVPSLFDVSTNNHFVTKGMLELGALGKQIISLEAKAEAESQELALALRQMRKEKSQALQEELFRNYNFLNGAGEEKNLLDIFADYNGMKPPSGAGECAAPKLFHYAFKHDMKALAIAEFWWGKNARPLERIHRHYYPACENKCRPILGYMVGECVKKY
tara:strand:+ start:14305 stop:15096 length:792 start_codon:yes stop_codon:yes gene_type:complete